MTNTKFGKFGNFIQRWSISTYFFSENNMRKYYTTNNSNSAKNTPYQFHDNYRKNGNFAEPMNNSRNLARNDNELR